ARLKQIAGEADRATATQDGTALSELVGELEQSSWLIPPANDLVQRVRGAFQQFSAEQARGEAERLEQELNAAYSAFDVEAGRRVRGQWQAMSAIAGIVPGDFLYERAVPALEWLEEQ